ncbi:MAG: RimK family alpha-L-glutamate ligase [Rubripirellula sp.]|nr:RimK family alpha-L-glutamate ligase [Rubripirellula sp.]
MSQIHILCLGAGDGWHSQELSRAANELDCRIQFATYESLQTRIENGTTQYKCDAGLVHDFDVLLTRTMPAGSLEQVTFRLAILHALVHSRSLPIVNPPAGLEIAIDKFATLQRVTALGYSVPDTIVVQSRSEAIEAFGQLGGDCVVKPIFGGEGRGVMRIRDTELAWTAFSTLENLDAVCYVQRFVPPGGCDTRLLVIGDTVRGIHRTNETEFRTNVSSGGRCERIDPSEQQIEMARRVCQDIGLKFASVDLLHSDDGHPRVIEVNAIPGWKGAQGVTEACIATEIVQALCNEVDSTGGPFADG